MALEMSDYVALVVEFLCTPWAVDRRHDPVNKDYKKWRTFIFLKPGRGKVPVRNGGNSRWNGIRNQGEGKLSNTGADCGSYVIIERNTEFGVAGVGKKQKGTAQIRYMGVRNHVNDHR